MATKNVVENTELEAVEEVVETVAEPVVEVQEEVKQEKRPFKFDFDKLDFSEKEEVTSYTTVKPENFEVIDEEKNVEENEADDSASMSFRNFFKKK